MKKLFDNFEPVSSKQWKQRIQFELGGADYNENLIWHSPEGIQVKPFYHRDEAKQSVFQNQKIESFKICQTIFVQDEAKSNLRAIRSLSKGAESIRFTIHNELISIEKLLENIPLEKMVIYFDLGFLSFSFIKKLDKIAQKNKATFYCILDPIGQLAKDGNWFKTLEKDNFLTLELISKNTKSISFIGINSSLYQNAGANTTQQIGYSLAHANEYFNRIKTINKPIVFEIAVGGNYFFEIAKLRAFRILFRLIAQEYHHNLDCHFLVSPTKRNKTLYGSKVNMLRTTTECMSAILGGADAIANIAFDAIYRKSNEFSDTKARNQLLLLKEESQLNKAINTADGSYYIESVTLQLAEKSLVLFKEIEKQGGFLKQLNEGVIQRKIQESAQKEQELFDAEIEKRAGDNTYFNPDEKMQDALELYPFVKQKPRKTLISPIIEMRLAEKTEQNRLKIEQKL